MADAKIFDYQKKYALEIATKGADVFLQEQLKEMDRYEPTDGYLTKLAKKQGIAVALLEDFAKIINEIKVD